MARNQARAAFVLLLGLATRAQSPACTLRLRSPKFDQVFSFQDEIELGTKLHLANATVARRVSEANAELRVELDAPATDKAGSGARRVLLRSLEGAHGARPIVIGRGTLARGYHSVRMSFALARGATALCSSAWRRFRVGALGFVAPSIGHNGEDALHAAPSVRGPSVFYSLHPLQLRARARVLRRLGWTTEAAASARAANRILGAGARHANFAAGPSPPSPSPSPSPFVGDTGLAATEQVEERFISFRTPAYGLHSQREEVLGMLMIAAALRRTLVLPDLDSDLVGEGGGGGSGSDSDSSSSSSSSSGGSSNGTANSSIAGGTAVGAGSMARPPPLSFGRVYDVTALHFALAGVVRVMDGAAPGVEIGSVPPSASTAAWVVQGHEAALSWYTDRFGGEAGACARLRHLHFVRDASAAAGRGDTSAMERACAATVSSADASARSTTVPPYLAMDPGRRFRHHPLDLEGAGEHSTVALIARMDAALAPAPRIRRRALCVARRLSELAMGVGRSDAARTAAGAQAQGFLAVHMRVEPDWQEYCARQESLFGSTPEHGVGAGAGGARKCCASRSGTCQDGGARTCDRSGAARFCFDAAEIVRRVDSHQAVGTHSIVYVAASRRVAASPELQHAHHVLKVWTRDPDPGHGVTRRHAYSAADFDIPCAAEDDDAGEDRDTHDRGPASSWPYTMQSALDAEVCKLATHFVGTSWSFFSNHVTRARARLSRPSFLYNLVDEDASIVQRTDAGELFEPHDATRVPAALE